VAGARPRGGTARQAAQFGRAPGRPGWADDDFAGEWRSQTGHKILNPGRFAPI
jgi:hypothetical protein